MPDPTAIQHFFELAYAAVEDGWMVLSRPDPTRLTRQGKPALASNWFDLARASWRQITQAATWMAGRHSVYYGVVVQRPDCTPAEFKRSRSAEAYQVPGLWFDLDLAYGTHAASTLPTTDQEALDLLFSLPAPPSLIVHSGGGLYGHWLFKEPSVITTPAEHEFIASLSKQFTYTLVQAGKAHGWTLDALGDLARVLRPPGTINYKYDKPVALIHEGHERYNPSDFDWLLPLPYPARAEHQGTGITGQPDLVRIAKHYGATLVQKSKTELAGAHPQHGSSTGDNFNVNVEKGLWHCWRHGTGGDALSLIAMCEGLVPCEDMRAGALRGDLFRRVVQVANETFQAALALGGPRLIVNGQAAPANVLPVSMVVTAPWPTLDDAAYYGLAGDIVRTITPYTESDPVAILVQFLAMLGNLLYRTPYFPVEADEHRMNLLVCLVGATSKARKGTSAGHPLRLLGGVDAAWKSRVTSGMSSGEGIIWHVRDAVYGQNKKGEEVCLDDGVEDKRLCILESEFARGLGKMGQDGNVLSAVLRQAWDHGNLNTLVSGRQKAPVKATNAHVSVIAHITEEELQRLLTDTEKANGLGNRFLWVCVKRSKLLPRGGRYPAAELKPFVTELSSTVFSARKVAQMQRTDAAEARWESLYTTMAEASPGLFGAIVARAEAQVLRLSCLYALLDKSDTVDVQHLDAAYALWRYCEDSARYLFGSKLGDIIADEVSQMLQLMAPEGMTRTAISDALGRNFPSGKLRAALNRLVKEGVARYTVEKTTGRPVETFFANVLRTYELNELSPPTPQGYPPLNSFNSLTRTHAANLHADENSAIFPSLNSSPIQNVPLPQTPSLPAVGDLVIPLAADGSQILDNGIPYPYLIIAIEEGQDGQLYARFMESSTGWPLAQCQKAAQDIDPLSGYGEGDIL